MLQADREEFDRQVALLCAAFNVPVADRADAYWLAFNKLRLDDWLRMVAHCVGQNGPDKMPSVPALWKVRATLRSGQRPSIGVQSGLSPAERLTEAALSRFNLSDWQLYSQHCRWSYVAGKAGGPVGVIIPQDLKHPSRYPAHRLMLADLDAHPIPV
jgi:hypothetical protein